MLLQPATTAVGMEPKAEGELGEVSGFKTEMSHWNNVVADYPDVFAEPGMPAERETKHRIELRLSAGISTVCLLLSWQKSEGSWMATWGQVGPAHPVHPIVHQSSSLGRRLVNLG